MTVVRRNVLASATARDAYLEGIAALDAADAGLSTSEAHDLVRRIDPGFRMRGIDQALSYYDLLVLWYSLAGGLRVAGGASDTGLEASSRRGPVAAEARAPAGSSASAIRGGPTFLPWHRHYLLVLERWIGVALGRDDFALPYWDWAADGELHALQQWQTALFTEAYLGEARGEVRSGRLGARRVRLSGGWGSLQSVAPRPLRRNAGADPNPNWRSLPKKREVASALEEPVYDAAPWTTAATAGLRNRLEGWRGIWSPELDNMVHVWAGGDMALGTSPNDPLFFLAQSNTDRIWEAWMRIHGRSYRSVSEESGGSGAQFDDVMLSLFDVAPSPEDLLNPADAYVYDDLAVA